MLTLDFEHCIGECTEPLDYRRQYCVVQRPLGIFVEYLVLFFVLPIGHMIPLHQGENIEEIVYFKFQFACTFSINFFPFFTLLFLSLVVCIKK